MKRFCFIVAFLGIVNAAWAVPAKRISKQVRQSDGTELTIRLYGDEIFHYWATSDGLRVHPNEHGDWVADSRDPKAVRQSKYAKINLLRSNKAPQIRKAMRAPKVPYLTTEQTTKKGLLILVNFKDKKMTNGDQSQAIFDQMLNAIDRPYGKNYGSIREYFRAQSYGLFDIEFDVVGPVTLANNMKYYGENDSQGNDKHPEDMVREACRLVDDQVNFADYDWDGNGEVENIYITYAGFGESSGASENTIWPHQWFLSEGGTALKLDNVTVDTYACGPELAGASGSTLEGIGTMCHEYSHCLGLPDFYDTNYSSFGMGAWSLMDYGCYNGDGEGYHPAGYTSYERWFCDWLEPKELKEGCVVENMQNIEQNPEAYIIYNDKNKNEYYLLANHQQVDWDKKALGHGMMILHVDYNERAWYNNTVNNVSSHQRMTLIPGDNKLNTITYQGSVYSDADAGDLWPGTSKNTELTDTSTPAAKLFNANTDGQKLMHKPITNIQESNKLISFTFMDGAPTVTIDAPMLNEATDVSPTGFTATWSQVAEAASYNLFLTEQQNEDSGENKIFDALNLFEDFAGFFMDESATADGSQDISGSLDDYTYEPGWTGSKIYKGLYGAKLATSSATGLITTPLIQGTTGTMTLFLDAYDWFNYSTYSTTGQYKPDGTTLSVSLLDAQGRELSSVEVTPNDAASEDFTMCVLNFSDVPESYQISVATKGIKKRAYIDYLLTFDGTFSEDEILTLFDEVEYDDNDEDGWEDDWSDLFAKMTQLRAHRHQMKAVARRLARRKAQSTISNVTETTYTFKELTPNTTYSLQVQAVDAEGHTSKLSNAVSVTLPTELYDAISEKKSTTSSRQSVFDLMGRSVTVPQRRAVYIVNGKKTIIK